MSDTEKTGYLVDVVEEILKMLLLNHNQQFKGDDVGTSTDQTPFNVSFTLNNKQKTTESCNVTILKASCNRPLQVVSLLKETPMPVLTQFILTMQELEKESHLVIQEVDRNNSSLMKTSVLWLDQEDSHKHATVKSEQSFSTKAACANCMTLQIRILLNSELLLEEPRMIVDCLCRTKMFNPHVQLSFSTDIGGTVHINLDKTDSIKCGAFDIYDGSDIYLGYFSPQADNSTVHIECSQGLKVETEALYSAILTCVSCFVPVVSDEEIHSSCKNPGMIIIQAYGPNRFPFHMGEACERLRLQPVSLLSWGKFGLQIKMPFKSSYSMQCSARMKKEKFFPTWAASYNRFSLFLAFVLTPDERTTHEAPSSPDNFENYWKQHIFSKEILSSFQTVAESSLTKLFQLKDSCEESVHNTPLESQSLVDKDSDMFKQMIPEIVNSLVDIFTKSTNSVFRSHVSKQIPAESRMLMSRHLESAFWTIRNKTSDIPSSDSTSQASQIQHGTTDGNEEQVDDWESSECSKRDRDGLKPESSDTEDLSFDWDDTILHSPILSLKEAETGHSVQMNSGPTKIHSETKAVDLHVDHPLSKKSLNFCQSFENITRPGEDLAVCQQFHQSLLSTNNTIVNLDDGICSTERSILHKGIDEFTCGNVLRVHEICDSTHQPPLLKKRESNKNVATLLKETEDLPILTDTICENKILFSKSIPPTQSLGDEALGFPRKRSSEFIDDITEVLQGCSVVEADTKSSFCWEEKRKRCEELDHEENFDTPSPFELFSQDSLNFSQVEELFSDEGSLFANGKENEENMENFNFVKSDMTLGNTKESASVSEQNSGISINLPDEHNSTSLPEDELMNIDRKSIIPFSSALDVVPGVLSDTDSEDWLREEDVAAWCADIMS